MCCWGAGAPALDAWGGFAASWKCSEAPLCAQKGDTVGLGMQVRAMHVPPEQKEWRLRRGVARRVVPPLQSV